MSTPRRTLRSLCEAVTILARDRERSTHKFLNVVDLFVIATISYTYKWSYRNCSPITGHSVEKSFKVFSIWWTKLSNVLVCGKLIKLFRNFHRLFIDMACQSLFKAMLRSHIDRSCIVKESKCSREDHALSDARLFERSEMLHPSSWHRLSCFGFRYIQWRSLSRFKLLHCDSIVSVALKCRRLSEPVNIDAKTVHVSSHLQ